MRQEGRKAGRQEGRKAGRQEGRKAGRQEGRKAGRQEGRKAKPPGRHPPPCSSLARAERPGRRCRVALVVLAAHVARAPALRKRRTRHQLDLVKQHQRQHDRADRVRREDHLRHRHAGREALLRPAEDDRDLVGAVEAEPLADERGQQQRDREQHEVDDEQAAERARRDLVPQAFVDGLAEGDVDDEQDRLRRSAARRGCGRSSRRSRAAATGRR